MARHRVVQFATLVFEHRAIEHFARERVTKAKLHVAVDVGLDHQLQIARGTQSAENIAQRFAERRHVVDIERASENRRARENVTRALVEPLAAFQDGRAQRCGHGERAARRIAVGEIPR